MDTCSEALAQLDDVIMHTFQQCVYHLTKVELEIVTKSVSQITQYTYYSMFSACHILYFFQIQVQGAYNQFLINVAVEPAGGQNESHTLKIEMVAPDKPQHLQTQKNVFSFFKDTRHFLITKMFLKLSHHHFKLKPAVSSSSIFFCALHSGRKMCIPSTFEDCMCL